MTNYLTTSILSLISMALLWVFSFWVYRDFCVEVFRQKVFALRDEFFDAATSGKIPFNHKSYGRLRLTMNGAIRFAEDISFVQVVLLSYFNRDNSLLNKYNKDFMEEIKSLKSEEKKVILDFQGRLDDLLMEHLLAISPLVVFFLIPSLIIYLLLKSVSVWIRNKLVAWSKEHFKTSLGEMQSLAYAVGND